MYAYKKTTPRMASFQQQPEEDVPARKHSALRRGFQRIISPFRRHSAQTAGGTEPDAFERYRKSENLIATGSIGSVYHYDDKYVMKDYSAVIDPEHKGRLHSAMNNAAAFNRLYGAGSANIMMRKTANPLQKAVSVKLRRISGVSLAEILAQGEIGLAEKAAASYAKGDVATQLAKKLELAGVDHNDINLGNILYDPQTDSFNLIDFDDSHLNPPGLPLNEFMVEDLVRKINYYFRTFVREVNALKLAKYLPSTEGREG
ncbi:lipopolysaccharide kinase InaA family protein [Kosakonia cowanii]|uniref:OspG family effector kinase n=1 Tax=Kosakonia cowanii TaxID=208223 RepID=UPI0023FA303B|nr:lipopolysaccharide kinase InaA family protein [Kosakonia cowanii]MDF7760490.1 lipopolysaccharide kinase InaA family protein [Kosakonia cowanii]